MSSPQTLFSVLSVRPGYCIHLKALIHKSVIITGAIQIGPKGKEYDIGARQNHLVLIRRLDIVTSDDHVGLTRLCYCQLARGSRANRDSQDT